MLQKRPSRRLWIVWMIYAVLAALLLSAASVAMTYIRPLPQIYVYLFSALWVAVWLFVVCVFLPLRFRHMEYALHEDRLEVTDGVLIRRRRIVPLSNVRYITLLYGPPERIAGIGSLILFVTGGMVLIEGVPLRQARELQAYLLDITGAVRHD